MKTIQEGKVKGKEPEIDKDIDLVGNVKRWTELGRGLLKRNNPFGKGLPFR